MRLLISAIAALALAPAAAVAAEHSGTVNSTAPTFAFGGGPGGSVFYVGDLPPAVPQDCNQVINYCDTTLVNVTEAGDVTFHAAPDDTQNPAPTLQDLDVYVYASDAEGTQGELVVMSESDKANESVMVSVVEPGHYLFVVNYALGGGYYAGDIGWAPTPVEDPEFEE